VPDPTKILNAESLTHRASGLDAHHLNGVKLAFVSLEPAGTPTHVFIDVEFYTPVDLLGANGILDDINVHGVPVRSIFKISGGTRLLAGDGIGQVQATQAAAGTGNVIRVRVEPIGDYSTYTLTVNRTAIDPLFGDIDFKFRPGCFNLNCAPEGGKNMAAPQEPVIDYLAKDYDSFKHNLIGAMMQRVPGWQATSEADLDQVLIDLVAADADELSDYQDRVMNEAYLATARKRVTLARRARLMDYHIHEGNQAGTWLALKVTGAPTLPAGLGAWAGAKWQDADSVIFASTQDAVCDARLNELGLYTWADTVSALEAGATSADLRLPPPLNPANQADADTLRNLLRLTPGAYLVLQQMLNPETGTVNGRDTSARQLLQLRDGDAAAESVFDPVASRWMVRVHWRKEDALTRRYCFVTRCTGAGVIEDVSLFYGNLVPVTHGRPYVTVFHSAGTDLGPADDKDFVHADEAHYEATPWGTVAGLPNAPLAYLDTPPGGEHPTRTTLEVDVGGFADPWTEQSDLIESESENEHFIVETDEYGASRIRFGNDVNGRALPEAATVTCKYRVALGEAGNVGLDSITGFDGAANPQVIEVWNPFDVVNGRAPEPVAGIVRRVPEAYRARQLRAVTLKDYVDRAEELAEVSRAQARYVWTGSWRGVRVAIDPKAGVELDDGVRRQIEGYLDAVRLIGEDLEVRPADFVPLDIHLKLCADPDYWPQDLHALLEQEFSDGYTSDGRRGFFHPDEWTFGQPLHASQLIGRALEVTGVGRVLNASMRRLHPHGGAALATVTLDPADVPENVVEKIDVQAFEIIRVANDPSRIELGRILFDIQGGRQ
jgi:hypothetical protein